MAYCYGHDDYCVRCGAQLLSPNQLCSPTDAELDEPVDLGETLTRRDWRLLLRATQSYSHYLGRRARRPTSKPAGADELNRQRLSRLMDALASAAGEHR